MWTVRDGAANMGREGASTSGWNFHGNGLAQPCTNISTGRACADL